MKKCLLFLLLIVFPCILSAQNFYGTWHGKLPHPINLQIVFHLMSDSLGRDVCTLDSPNESVHAVEGSVISVSLDSIKLQFDNLGILYKGKFVGDSLYGTFFQRGILLPLNLCHGALKKAYRPQTPQQPFPYKTMEVVFENKKANALLAGTLTYPVGYKEGMNVPVVLMVTGSGPQNRDEEIFDHKPFSVIADYLARHGVASLRYDDRKVGKSTGDNYPLTTAEVAEDAACGIHFLRQMEVFSKVGLLGHSEGAMVAFILGNKGIIDFAVSMAGLGVKGDEALYAQAQKIYTLSGRPFPYTKDQWIESLKSRNSVYLDYLINYDPIPDIKGTKCPVLAVNGDKDVQVLLDLNLSSIEKNLSHNVRNEVKAYDNLNHMFQRCTTGLHTEYYSIEQK